MNMSKLVIYLLLLLVYLGLSKSLSPSEYGVNYVFNKESLSKLIGAGPASVILTDIHSTGFIIKTYYHKYKVVYGFQSYEEIIVRTSGTFSKKHLNHIGLSILRRYKDDKIDDTPLPPGSLFIGDRNFGSWKKNRNGDKVWSFYRVYRLLPTYLGWGSFRPTYKFYQEVLVRTNNNKVFLGFNDEFGTVGELTKQYFPQYFTRNQDKKIDFKGFFQDYLKQNF
jgi:hypothetical protein